MLTIESRKTFKNQYDETYIDMQKNNFFKV